MFKWKCVTDPNDVEIFNYTFKKLTPKPLIAWSQVRQDKILESGCHSFAIKMDALSSTNGLGVFIGFKKWSDCGVRVGSRDFIGY